MTTFLVVQNNFNIFCCEIFFTSDFEIKFSTEIKKCHFQSKTRKGLWATSLT